MIKELDVNEFSNGLESIITQAIATHLRPAVEKFVEENNCFEDLFDSDGVRTSVVCRIQFAALKKDGLEVKNFRANHFFGVASGLSGHLPHVKKEMLDKATESVAKQVYFYLSSCCCSHYA